MSKKSYSIYHYIYKGPVINLYFRLNNSTVYSKENKDCNNWTQEIVVIIEYDIAKHESITELNRYCRRDLLIIQGIITFFTGIPLTVYNSPMSENTSMPIEIECELVNEHLSIEEQDFTIDLEIMLKHIERDSGLIVTLLDRWRKALYLKCESEDADLFFDEAILTFFHIFETLGESCTKELKANLEKNIDTKLEEYFQIIFFNEEKAQQEVNQNKKAFYKMLVEGYLNLSVKIKYFLNKYNMLDENVSDFVDNMIKTRNKIAHGRIIRKQKFIWPLSPFLSFSFDAYNDVENLVYMTAEMISKYIGIQRWEADWKIVKDNLLPAKEFIKQFFDNKLKINNFNSQMLFDGNEYNITWNTIFIHYVKNPSIDFLNKIEEKLKTYFIDTNLDEEKAADLFNISILFADSADQEIRMKAIENIYTIIDKRWYGWSNYRDVYSYLDFYNVKIDWYKKYLFGEES